MSEIPDGRPYTVGRDFTVGERFPLREGDLVGYEIDGEIHTTTVTDHLTLTSLTLIIESGGLGDPLREAGDRFREAVQAIRELMAGVDFTAGLDAMREFHESFEEAKAAEEAPHPLHPAIKKPSKTPPPWAIDVGKAKRNPRSTRRVK